MSFNVLDTSKTWRKAKTVWVLDTSKTWRKAKTAWVLDGSKVWRKGYTAEVRTTVRVHFNMATYQQFDGGVQWGRAKHGFYGSFSKEYNGWWYNPNRDGAGAVADIRACMPSNFGSVKEVHSVKLHVNRNGGTGDHPYTRTMRIKQTTKTGVTSPDAVNGICDLSISAGGGWKYNLQHQNLVYSVHNCLAGIGGARNLIMNDDTQSWGTGGSGAWSYNYMGLDGAYMDIDLTYNAR